MSTTPINIERLAKRIAKKSPKINAPEIERACKALAEYVDKEYFLIECLRHGVVYHHGSVPDVVKLYIENIFSKSDNVKFIATTSTLLEGVNIPAERLFLLDYKKGPRKLSPSQFKNLLGRVCRFKEVFDPKFGNLDLLEPQIYLIGSEYISKSANIKKFLKDSMRIDKKEKEEAENVLLENAELSSEDLKARDDAEVFLENFEPGTVTREGIEYAQTEFGKSCFLNSIYEIKILENEHSCQSIVDALLKKGKVAEDAKGVIELIDKVFLPVIVEKKLKRLSQPEAQAFYAMLLDWRIKNTSLPEMISNFLRYWKSREQTDPLVYVGNKWGEVSRSFGDDQESNLKYWVDISKKSHSEKINLAIVRIKEEQDILDNSIIKLVEVLFELKLIEQNLYEQIRFGTADPTKIALLKNGFSSALAGLLLRKYRSGVEVDVEASKVTVMPDVRQQMVKNQENEILVFELDCNVAKST